MPKKPREGSARDLAEDKKMAKARGMSMKAWERSDADKQHDAPMKSRGGKKGK
jgi:hypothetical protein